MTRIIVYHAFGPLRATGAGDVLWTSSSAVGSAFGWRLRINSSRTLIFEIADGATVLQTVSSAIAHSPGEVIGRTYVAVATYGSGTLGLYHAGLDATLGGLSGFTPNTTEKGLIGARNNTPTEVAENVAVIYCLATDSETLDAAGRASAYATVVDNLRAGREKHRGLPFVAANYWDARDWDPAAGTWPTHPESKQNQPYAQVGEPQLFHFNVNI